jgi:uncharacterized protein YraI
MQFRNALLAAVATTTVTLSTAVAADFVATAVTPLNIRSGLGPQYPVIGYIPQNTPAVIVGCLQDSLWCRVNYNGQPGWADSEYLTATIGGHSLVVSQSTAQFPTITYELPATVGSAAPPSVPVISGTLVRRSAAGDPLVIKPPPAVREYVLTSRARPVYLSGEVVEGAGLPPDVALTPVPDYQYQYAYVNGVRVLVEPQTRQVIYVYR